MVSSLLVPSVGHAEEPATVLVHVEPDAVVVQTRQVVVRDDGDRVSWVDVCVAPCDRSLLAAGSYRVDGEGIMPSRTFAIGQEAYAGRLGIKVDPSPTMALGGGIVTLATGSVAFLSGFAFLAYGMMISGDSCPSGCAGSGFTIAGVTLLPVGALLTLFGILIVHASARSQVAFTNTF
ncbi:hypothetical protein BH09MYX1_BH09MYX1_46910 [soil metagenome]